MSSLFTFAQSGLLSADNESDNNVLLSRFCVSRDTLSIICDVTGVSLSYGLEIDTCFYKISQDRANVKLQQWRR